MNYGQAEYGGSTYGVKSSALRVYDSSLNFVGEIDNYSSCIITRKYRGVEELTMTTPLTEWSALSNHNWIYAGPKRIFEILHVEVDQENPRNVIVKAYGGGLTLSKRITYPPAESAYDTVTGSPDAVVKHYITNNIITPTNAARTIPLISLAAAQAGTDISDQTRYKNLYDEVVRVLSITDVGFFFDVVSGSIVFDTYSGTDRTITNGVNSPAIFSIDYDNLKSSRYISSVVNSINHATVGGQGEGELRTIVEVGTKTGYQRFEAFVDARDTTDNAELTNRGTAEIVDGTLSYEAEANTESNLIYQTDYDLGDLVSVIDKTLGISLDTRITEIQEVKQAGQAEIISLTFGNSLPTILTPINNQRRKIAGLSTN